MAPRILEYQRQNSRELRRDPWMLPGLPMHERKLPTTKERITGGIT